MNNTTSIKKQNFQGFSGSLSILATCEKFSREFILEEKIRGDKEVILREHLSDTNVCITSFFKHF